MGAPRTAATLGMACSLVAGAAAQDSPTIDILLLRGSMYVEAYERELTGIVAEERLPARGSLCLREADGALLRSHVVLEYPIVQPANRYPSDLLRDAAHPLSRTLRDGRDDQVRVRNHRRVCYLFEHQTVHRQDR